MLHPDGSTEFPATSWTVVAAARDPGNPECRRNLEKLCQAYWKPVFAYLRSLRRSTIEEAKDLTQEFFVHLLEGSFLHRVEESQGRFRAYLKVSLKNFWNDRFERAHRVKRGGGRRLLSLDMRDEVPRIEPADTRTSSPEEELDRHWAQVLVQRSLDLLRHSIEDAVDFEIFRRYYYPSETEERLTYASLAGLHGLGTFDVTNRLHRTRRRFRQTVLDLIRDSVASEQAARNELEELFGAGE